MPDLWIKDELKVISGVDFNWYIDGEIGLRINVLWLFWNLEIFDRNGGWLFRLDWFDWLSFSLLDFIDIRADEFRVILDELLLESFSQVQLSSDMHKDQLIRLLAIRFE